VRFRVACVAGALYLMTLVPGALGQTHLTYSFPCDMKAYVVAQTNQVPTTIKVPENTGSCNYVLFCTTAKAKIQGTELTDFEGRSCAQLQLCLGRHANTGSVNRAR